ncbi:hypothetical protein [Pseudanabaena sp. FACHB-2040]|uniref:hypothetical protein n=1 Tax=Pseudanabaena sp. FACHB-2040 TaxID=2692859 RepID=UPI00168770B7|nr:hypothetical protein [Pseudanabaena sp. FACHB-2040]MBD2258970.1 hypothetical protein [Pseudanabaena sp. FACHB-2040]
MKSTLFPTLTESLQEAIQLAQSVNSHQEAQATFERLHQELETQNPQAADLLALLWREYLGSQRSATFWKELCQVEKHLSDRLSESHLQLKQNYLRLMQEQ